MRRKGCNKLSEDSSDSVPDSGEGAAMSNNGDILLEAHTIDLWNNLLNINKLNNALLFRFAFYHEDKKAQTIRIANGLGFLPHLGADYAISSKRLPPVRLPKSSRNGTGTTKIIAQVVNMAGMS